MRGSIKTAYQPEQTVVLTLGTASEVLNVLIEEELGGKLIKKQWVPFTMMYDYTVKLTEASRGNHFVHLSFAFDNRASFYTKTLIVPFSNKELNIEYQTFRDKMLPASEEEWRLKISGANKEKVAAEMVAAMYDASLDQFAPNHWHLSLFPTRSAIRIFDAPTFGEAISTPFYDYTEGGGQTEDDPRLYRNLNWFGMDFGGNGYGGRMLRSRAMPMMAMDAASAPAPKMPKPQADMAVNYSAKTKREGGNVKELKMSIENDTNKKTTPSVKTEDLGQIKARTNLNETVFFFPNLMTDADGNVVVKFTMNEALTKWKFLALAHTTDLKVGVSEKTVQTQKDLMVFPNAPRFLREGDAIEFSGKVSNLTADVLRGQARLELFDALTMQPIDDLLGNKNATIDIEIKGNESTPLLWSLQIPTGKVQAVTYRIVAKAGNFSDGEEAALPVLTNRMLVTETLPLSIRGGATKTFVMESLKNSAASNTLTHNGLTLEMTQNPAWYAVQALPYLMEYPYDCTEQIFSRYYANALATNVANSTPKIKAVFDRWREYDVSALQSNLSKNQELKTALLEETPWVLQAQNEAIQKKNIGLLFDLNRMANESKTALRKLSDRQLGKRRFCMVFGRTRQLVHHPIFDGGHRAPQRFGCRARRHGKNDGR
ncbi:MAG: alpha-2-macroglobulin family protein [Saprospiraceae bacterium]|nr:alpha-2-macroglobulin family protein [Saprospiraceae bacterium]